TKLSKKGKSALYLISQTQKQWIPADLLNYEENDLGEYTNIEIQLKSGKTYRTKPQDYIEPTDPQEKEIFLKPEEVILFFNNSTKTQNLLDAETIYLNDL
ncbi:10803_t:CDS:1, partial [Funneliformis geosporum]